MSPKGTTAVWDDDHLVFKTPALNSVSSTFVCRGYRFKGLASILESGALYDEAIAFCRNRGSRNAIAGIVLIRVTTAQPIDWPAYDLGLSADEVRDRWERRQQS